MHAKKTLCLVTGLLLGLLAIVSRADEPTGKATHPEKIIIDTDIGSDIDDAFAVALALQNSEVRILGITTASGDTAARAKIVDRMLAATGHTDIPVAVGIPTTLPHGLPPIGRQTRFGENSPFAAVTHPLAVDFILQQIRRFPGEVTLVTIGPLTNVGGLIDKDPGSVHHLKRVVMMGGAINSGYGVHGDKDNPPVPEYNIVMDIPAAQKVFQSGVPIYVMPLDATTQLKLDEVKRDIIFSRGTPLTDSLALLYLMWGHQTPVLFDAMPVAYVIEPKLCPVEPMSVVVDDKGVTRAESGKSNTQVCLTSDPEAFFHFFMARFQ